MTTKTNCNAIPFHQEIIDGIRDLLSNLNVGPHAMKEALLAWACWSVPLFATEVILQVRKFNKLRLAPGKKVERPVTHLEENQRSPFHF